MTMVTLVPDMKTNVLKKLEPKFRKEQLNLFQAEGEQNGTESDYGQWSSLCKNDSSELRQSSNRMQEILGQSFGK